MDNYVKKYVHISAMCVVHMFTMNINSKRKGKSEREGEIEACSPCSFNKTAIQRTDENNLNNNEFIE